MALIFFEAKIRRGILRLLIQYSLFYDVTLFSELEMRRTFCMFINMYQMQQKVDAA